MTTTLKPFRHVKTGRIEHVDPALAAAFVARGELATLSEAEQFADQARAEANLILAQRIATDAVRTALGEKADQPHYTYEFLRAVGRNDGPYLKRHFGSEWGNYQGMPIGEKGMKAAALAEVSGVTGGYEVPPNIRSALLSAALTRSIFRRFGAVSVPFAGRSMLLGTPDATTAQAAGIPPYAGGLSFSWTAESQTRTESEPTVKAIELCKWELTGYALVSKPLYEDGDAFPAWLEAVIEMSIAWMEDYFFFQGNGAGQPLGVLNAPASLAINRNTGGKFVAADAEAMIAKLPPGCYDQVIWACSPTALGSSGWSGITGIVPNADMKLFGRPVCPTDALPALGTRGDVVLMHPPSYLIGDHLEEGGSLEIAISEHVKMLQNQVAVRTVRRIDGRPWMDQPMTLGDGSTQASPFVILN